VEVHSFCAKSWGDPDPLPNRTDPIPGSLDWNLWLGVNEHRPYLEGYYHPKNWRRRLGFGVGNMGDMGCHIFHPWFKALRPAAPISVTSKGPAPGKDSWPERFHIEYLFPGTEMTAGKTFKATWYDGDIRPPDHIQDLVGGAAKVPGQGSIVVGEEGAVLIPHAENPQIALHPIDRFAPFKGPGAPGTSDEHYLQFIDAILGKVKTTRSNFPYAAQMTEAVLLGTIASFYPGERLDWNASSLSFPNKPLANHHLCRQYRKGWTLPAFS
jgi:predicted dehydrogenase